MEFIVYLLAAVALACWAAVNWLLFVSDLPYWVALVSAGCLVLLFGALLLASFQRTWRAVIVGLLAILLVFSKFLGVEEPVAWLQQTGFRVHASPTEQYLSQCKLRTVSEDSKIRQLGLCASLTSPHRRIDIVYDTSGSDHWPLTPGERESRAVPSRVRLFGSFIAYVYTD